MENKVVRIKGTAYTRESYLFKKKHPIRWKVSRFFRRLAKTIDDKVRIDAR